ncbi:hypothetical protein L210DRAFT_3503785 [Boletus edulis BED1]|uniref:Uncharacterized protein n=1 Tax=Boletus edulis BED1 TaxID=1328754 RepID=A0AAD4BV63_BOLED|nr:hypothetical protein L210DRAFT_3503785 [Boletus edulis BED1]
MLNPGCLTQDALRRTLNPGCLTQDALRRTLNPGCSTWDALRRTLNVGHSMQDAQPGMLNVGHSTQDTQHGTLNMGHSTRVAQGGLLRQPGNDSPLWQLSGLAKLTHPICHRGESLQGPDTYQGQDTLKKASKILITFQVHSSNIGTNNRVKRPSLKPLSTHLQRD